jgi:PAS domain S-box-containing protein
MAKKKEGPIKPNAPSSPRSHQPYLLLVEDEPTQAGLIRLAFRNADPNIKVKVAGSLEEYRSAIASSTPDIVLMDINLPDGKAFDVLTSPLEAGLFPIIVMTGYSDEKIAVRAMKAGAIDYVVKSSEAFKAMPHTLEHALREWKLIQECKQAKEALRKSEDKFKFIFDRSPVGKTITLPAGEININMAFCKMLGYTPEELQQKKWQDITHPDDIAMTQKMMDTLFSGEHESERFMKRFVHKNGSTVWVDLYSSLRKDQDEKPLYSITTVIDITERQQMEESIVRALQEWQITFDATNDAMWILDKDQRILRANKTSEQFFHRTSKELIGKHCWEVVHGTTQPIPAYPVLRAKKSLHRESMELQIGNGWFEITVDPILDVTGRYDGAVHIVSDVTESKRAEEALRASESQFRELWSATVEGIVILDKGIIIEVNDAMCKIFGYTREYVLGKSLLEFSSPEMIDRVRERIDVGIEGRFETTALRADGTKIVLETFAKPFIFRGKAVRMVTNRDVTEKRLAEDDLRESESRYRSVLQSASDAIITADDGEMIIGWNSGAEQIFGYSYTEAVGQPLISIMPLYRQVGTASGGDQNVVGKIIELAGVRKDKSIFPIELSLSSWETSSGRFITGIIRDITERKQAEEKMKDALSEAERLRKAMDHVSSYIYMKDLQSRYIYANKTTLELFGCSAEELVGCDDTRFFPADTAKRLQEIDLQVFQGKQMAEEIDVVDAQGGRRVYWEVKTPMYTNSENKTIFGVIGISTDITERKRIEDEVRKLSNAVEQSGSSIVITNLDGKIEYVNSKFVELTGYSVEEALGKNPRILKSGQTSGEEYKNLWSTITNGQVWRGEFHNKKKNGDLYWETATISPIRDANGKIMHFVAVKEDITQQRIMEEQLRQVQKLDELGTLAGGIAHDFNNILGIILAYITSINRAKDDPKKIDLAVETIVKAVDRGKTIVQQVLTFARKTETAFGGVDVNDVVKEITSMILETFPKVISYSHDLDKNIPAIHADRSQLYQALLNLSVNARDAMMPAGGVLSISTHLVPVAQVRIQHQDASSSSYICIEVSDTGEGMTEEVRQRIFEPFFTTKEKGRGTGLGLSVVFGVVQAHKGYVDVISECGKGTTFQLYFPVSQVAAPTSADAVETMEEIPGGTETVLIVEDEELLMMNLQRVLVEKGYKVLTASDGLAAVMLYKEREQEIALVLTDLGLPKITGMEECAQIRKINPNARFIIATGYLDPNVKSEFLKKGIEHFLYKPYNLKNVLKVIREVLDKK